MIGCSGQYLSLYHNLPIAKYIPRYLRYQVYLEPLSVIVPVAIGTCTVLVVTCTAVVGIPVPPQGNLLISMRQLRLYRTVFEFRKGASVTFEIKPAYPLKSLASWGGQNDQLPYPVW